MFKDNKYKTSNMTSYTPFIILIGIAIIIYVIYKFFGNSIAKIKEYWSRDPFISLCVVCVIAIIIIGVYQLIFSKSKGSWSKYFLIPGKDTLTNTDDNIYKQKQKQGKDSKGEIVSDNLYNFEVTKLQVHAIFLCIRFYFDVSSDFRISHLLKKKRFLFTLFSLYHAMKPPVIPFKGCKIFSYDPRDAFDRMTLFKHFHQRSVDLIVNHGKSLR